MKIKQTHNTFIYLLILVVIFALVLAFLPRGGPEQIDLPAFISYAKPGQTTGEQISIIRQDGDKLIGLNDDDKALYVSAFVGGTDDLRNFLSEEGVLLGEGGVKIDVEPSGTDWGMIALQVFLPIALIGGLFFFFMRSARGPGSQAFSFGKSRARLSSGDKPTTTFTDVAGVDEAKEEVQEVVEFLKSPRKFQTLGGRIPRGILLVGPPGTGKTLLAKAIAGEAKVPFYSINGSEFVEMFVGVGAARVRDLFEQAKHNAPCIVFIDEIDAVGRHRGAGLGGGHDEREQTLNQILSEMDGFDTETNVIVLAATNRPDILDPALLRPGRFDRRIIVDLPDINGRKAILGVHAKGKPMAKGVNLDTIAKETPGFSGADLANLLNEAAILASRHNRKSISLKELEDAVDRVSLGPEKKSRVITQREKEITAYHESGHALTARMLPNADAQVHKISIIARGMAGGWTRFLPSEDRHLYTKSQLNDAIAILLGGRIAEEITFNEVTDGAQKDLSNATSLARKMVTEYGMSDKLGLRTFGQKQELIFLGREISEQKDYSDETAREIDEEIYSILHNAYNTAKKILNEHKTKLRQIAVQLIANETLGEKELNKLFEGLTPQSVSS